MRLGVTDHPIYTARLFSILKRYNKDPRSFDRHQEIVLGPFANLLYSRLLAAKEIHHPSKTHLYYSYISMHRS